MSKALNLDYHYGTEAEQYSFYRIPKMLFTSEQFKGISIEAKVLYGLMLDRMALSMKNGWLDKENRVFIYFTLEDAISLLGCGHTKVVKLLSELDTKKGIGLIERKKQGQGKPTIIYVKSFSSLGTGTTTTKKEDRKTYPKPNFKTSENGKSEPDVADENTENASENLEDTTPPVSVNDDNTENDNVSFPSISDTEVLTSQNEKSALLENGSQDFSNTDTNKTYVNNTKFNDTKSIYPSISSYKNQKSSKTENDGLMDGVDYENLEDIVLDELWDEERIPYIYTASPRKMEIAIHILTEYKMQAAYFEKSDMASRNDFSHSVFCLFNEALIEMLTSKQPMTLKGSYVTNSKVYDKLRGYVKFDSSSCYIDEIINVATGDFEKACENTEIRNHLQYMKSCIWNALQVGDIAIQSLIKKDFG